MKNTLLAGTAALALASSAQAALVAHYNLDETTGSTVADSSGNGNTGTVVAGAGSPPDLTATGIATTSGMSTTDDGEGYVSAANLYSGNDSRSVSAWFNATTIDSTQSRITSTGSGAAESFDITLESSDGGNSIGLRYGNGNMFWSGSAENGGDDIATGVWNHVVVTYESTATVDGGFGAGLTVYLNGVALTMDGGNPKNGTQELNTSGDFLIAGNGGLGNNGGYLNGSIDDVQVYDAALSSSEVSFLFNNPTVAVPEPSSAALLGLGGIALILRRRK